MPGHHSRAMRFRSLTISVLAPQSRGLPCGVSTCSVRSGLITVRSPERATSRCVQTCRAFDRLSSRFRKSPMISNYLDPPHFVLILGRIALALQPVDVSLHRRRIGQFAGSLGDPVDHGEIIEQVETDNVSRCVGRQSLAKRALVKTCRQKPFAVFPHNSGLGTRFGAVQRPL